LLGKVKGQSIRKMNNVVYGLSSNQVDNCNSSTMTPTSHVGYLEVEL